MTSDGPKIFDLEHALEIFDGNRRMLGRIVMSFLADIPRDLDRLMEAVAQQDGPQVKHLAHRMAGAAGMVGAMCFMRRARELEDSSRETFPDSAPAMAGGLRDDFERFRAATSREGLGGDR